MDVAEKANGLTTSAFYSLSRNDLLGNILYSDCSVGELLIFGRSPENGGGGTSRSRSRRLVATAHRGRYAAADHSLGHPAIAYKWPETLPAPSICGRMAMFLLIENLAPAADVVGAFCGSIANPSRESFGTAQWRHGYFIRARRRGS